MKQNYFSKLIFLFFILLNTSIVLGQTSFTGLGAANSGGAGFKTISDANLVVSNDFSEAGGELYWNNGSSTTKTLTIKADGIDADFLDFNGLTFYSFVASGITIDASSTVVFKNTAGSIIRTMTLNANKVLSNSDTDISAIFDNNTTLPVMGVASIDFNFVIDNCCINGNNFSNLTFKTITYSNPNVLSSGNFAVNKPNLKLSPIPAAGHIQISGLTQAENYTIYNILGNQLGSGMISNNEKINLQNLTKGLYFLTFKNGATLKFIKK